MARLGLDTHATCLVTSCQGRFLEFYSDKTTTYSALDIIQVIFLDSVGSISLLAKHISLLVYCLRQRVDDWLRS